MPKYTFQSVSLDEAPGHTINENGLVTSDIDGQQSVMFTATDGKLMVGLPQKGELFFRWYNVGGLVDKYFGPGLPGQS